MFNDSKWFIRIMLWCIPVSQWRKAARQKILGFHPIRDYCHQRRIKKYLHHKAIRGRAKIVVYTAIAGAYDELRSHQYLCWDWDYICFTDIPVNKLHAWEIRPMTLFDHPQPVRKAKYYKMFPDVLFPDYEYSIWVDGTVDVTGSYLEKIVQKLVSQKDFVMGVAPHSQRNCIYDEANECIRQAKDEPEVIRDQVEFLRKNEYPVKAGLFETGVMLRRHGDFRVKEVMQNWWGFIMRYSFRDQLSLNYVIWKNKLEIDFLFPSQENSFLYHDDFIVNQHAKSRCVDRCDRL